MLVGTQLKLQQWMMPFAQPTGGTGLNFDWTHARTCISSIPPSPTNSNCLSVSLMGCGKATMANVIKSSLRPPKPCSVTWPRPLCGLDMSTHVSHMPAKTWTSHFPNSISPTKMRTPYLSHKIIQPSCQKGTTIRMAITNLIVIAFFFLLRPGEYTIPLSRRPTCTV